MFLKFLAELEVERKAAWNAVRKMKEHALFPEFCLMIGAGLEDFAQDQNEAATEVQLFEEWLAEREAVARHPPTADEAETQVVLWLHVGSVDAALCFCKFGCTC